jgi:hypothetical protein
MITANDLNDRTSPRIRDYLPRFQAAAVPDPETGDWSAWQSLMGQRGHAADAGPRGALNIVTDTPYGTVSSSLIALPKLQNPPKAPIWLFAAGRPDEAAYAPVEL